MESVTRVVPRENFSLELWFSTGDHRLFDARPYLNRGVFTQLQDIKLFKQAFVAMDTVCCRVISILPLKRSMIVLFPFEIGAFHSIWSGR